MNLKVTSHEFEEIWGWCVWIGLWKIYCRVLFSIFYDTSPFFNPNNWYPSVIAKNWRLCMQSRQLHANLHATGGYTYKTILQCGRQSGAKFACASRYNTAKPAVLCHDAGRSIVWIRKWRRIWKNREWYAVIDLSEAYLTAYSTDFSKLVRQYL